MKDEDFDLLLQSAQEAVEISQGKRKPARSFHYDINTPRRERRPAMRRCGVQHKTLVKRTAAIRRRIKKEEDYG